jgi:hypothetical protein
MLGKQNPAAAETAPGSQVELRLNFNKPQVKWRRVLTALLAGRSFNRFDAERELHDHCLHSTVATIESKGVRIARRVERVPGFQGLPTDVCRYWLEKAPESTQRAREVLGMAERRQTDAEGVEAAT